MALSDRHGAALLQPANSTGTANYSEPPKEQYQEPARTPGFNMGFLGNLGAELGFHDEEASVTEYRDELVRLIDSNAELKRSLQMKTAILRGRKDGLLFYGIVLAGQWAETVSNEVAYHILVIEKAGKESIKTQTDPRQGAYEILITAGQSVDSDWLTLASAKVTQLFSKVRETIYSSSTVIPRAVLPSDKVTMSSILENSVRAIVTDLISLDKSAYVPYSVAALGNAGGKLMAQLSFNEPQLMNVVNKPVRSDVNIEFSITTDKGRGAINSVAMENKISHVTGFFDFDWDPDDVPRIDRYGHQHPGYSFTPRFIITDFRGLIQHNIEFILQAIYTATMVAEEDYMWLQTFYRPTMGVSGTDIKELGALCIESNAMNHESGLSPALNTRDISVDERKFREVFQNIARPGMAISVDVPVSGPSSWYLGVLNMAAQRDLGDNGAGPTNAYNIIWYGASALLGREFENKFPHGTPIFSDSSLIYNGTYTDVNGEIKDLREIDYLAVANLCASNERYQYIRDYTDTIYQTQIDANVRAYQRRKIVDQLTRNSAVFDTAINRLTFSGAFLLAMRDAMRANNVSVDVRSPYKDGDFNRMRAAAHYKDRAVLASGASFNSNRGVSYNTNRSIYNAHDPRFDHVKL